MKKDTRVHLVLGRAYLEGWYVDSAWTTADGAKQRVIDLRTSTEAFAVNKNLGLTTLEIRLDVMGVPIVIHAPTDIDDNFTDGFGVHRPRRKSSAGQKKEETADGGA